MSDPAVDPAAPRVFTSWAVADDNTAVICTVWRGGEKLEERRWEIVAALGYAESITAAARMALTRARREAVAGELEAPCVNL